MTYTDVGIYPILCHATDINGCSNTNDFIIYIIVSGPTNMELETSLPAGTYCVGDTISLSATPIFDSLEFVSIDTINFMYMNDSSLLIPDANGNILSTTIDVPSYMDNPSFIFQDLVVCIDIEHTFYGDLEIGLTCPDGNNILLQEFSGFSGGGHYLGIPIDDGSTTAVGTPYQYCWTADAINGTWLESSSNASANNGTLPPGNYTPFNALNEMYNCTKTGTWTLSITDLWGSDNGYLFSWSLGFIVDDSIHIDNSIPYIAETVEQYWELPDGTQIDSNHIEVVIEDSTYTYHIVDQQGCSFSYDVELFFGNSICSLGQCIVYPTIDTSFAWCHGDTINFEGIEFTSPGVFMIPPADLDTYCDTLINVNIVGNAMPYELVVFSTPVGSDLGTVLMFSSDYYFAASGIIALDSLSSGQHILEITNGICTLYDTVFIDEYLAMMATVEIEDDPVNIDAYSARVFITGGVPDYTILWSTGQSGIDESLSNLSPGLYWVKITDAIGNEVTVDFEVEDTSPTYDPSIFSNAQAYPNPTGTVLNINYSFHKTETFTLALYDIFGKEIFSERNTGKEIYKTEDVNLLPSGIYLLRLSIANQSWVEKIIIE